MDDLFNLNPKVSTAVCVLIAYLLIDDLTANEQNVLGNWLMLISQLIITNAAAQGLIERRVQGNIFNINSENTKSIYNPLVYNIDELRKALAQVYPEQMNKIFNSLKNKVDSMQETYYNDLHN